MENNKEIVLIAGGTGFIGKHVISRLEKEKIEIRVLTRNKKLLTNPSYFYWNPDFSELDQIAVVGVTTLINLCGEGIADKRWTKRRKKILLGSRVQPAIFLFNNFEKSTTLKQYITASGINCYPVNSEKNLVEEDAFASDFVSQLVYQWEKSADLFASKCNVLKLRIGFVLAKNEGGILKLEKSIKYGFGAYLGKGTQSLPWIHINDLAELFTFGIKKRLSGVYNAIGGNTTNIELTNRIAIKYNKQIFLPNVPRLVLYLLLGNLASLLLNSLKANNQKIKDTGFEFQKETISALEI